MHAVLLAPRDWDAIIPDVSRTRVDLITSWPAEWFSAFPSSLSRRKVADHIGQVTRLIKEGVHHVSTAEGEMVLANHPCDPSTHKISVSR